MTCKHWPLVLLVSAIPASHAVVDANATESVRISRDTTYIVGPLGHDGLPDYLAAINQKFGAVVKMETNAVVFLRAALGFKDMSGRLRDNTSVS